MRRLLWPLALTALSALAAAGAALAEPGRAPASVAVVECQPGTAPLKREAAFESRVRALPGTDRMQVRFTLLERLGDGSFRALEVPGLDVWRTSRRQARRFVYTQEVTGLEPDAAYRVAVDFRWLAADGDTLRFARRRSDVCEQEGALPNLRIVRISTRAGSTPSTAGYSVVVRNAGGADVRNVKLGLLADGTGIAGTRIGRIEARDTRTIRFAGAACSEAVSAVIDPDNAIRETAEDDNVLSVPCPLG